jgi:hypothetical protein
MNTSSLGFSCSSLGRFRPHLHYINTGSLLSRESRVPISHLRRKHLKKFVILSMFALLFFAVAANAGSNITALASTSPCQGANCNASATNANGILPPGTLFYGGDLDLNDPNQNGLANENDAIVGGNPYGAATYQNFTLNSSSTATGLFTNNLSQLTPTSGYWEIRSGVSEGNGGTLVASGTGNVTNTPTGRSDFGYTEYRNEVDGLSVALNGGTQYWMSVVPVCTSCAGRSFNSNTDGLNSIGSQQSDNQYFNSPFFGTNFTNANTQGVYSTFSSGVVGNTVPEPSSLIMLGSGLLAVAGVVRRRLS